MFLAKTALPVLASTAARAPECDACGLHKTCKSPKMRVDGRGRKGILVVGEAPGEREDDQGRPLVGPSGRRTAAALLRAGVDMRNDCWLFNALSCRPPRNRLDAHPGAVGHCRPNVVNLVTELKPTVVLLLGGAAVQSVVGWLFPEREPNYGIGRWAGYRIPDRKVNAWVCPTYHPAHALRTAEQGDPVVSLLFDDHVRRAVRKAAAGRPWPGGPPRWEDKVEVVRGAGRAAAEIARLLRRPVTFAFDYETNMGDPDHPDGKIVCCSVSTGAAGRTLAFPWTAETRDALLPRLADPAYPKVGANQKFEQRWTLAKTGVRVRWGRTPLNTWDCVLGAHAIDNGNGKLRPVTGTKFQAYARLGVPNYDDRVGPYLKPKEKGVGRLNKIHQIDPHTLLLYCGMDSLVEYELARHQSRQIGVPFPEPK